MTRCRPNKPPEFSAAWRSKHEDGDPPFDFAALFGSNAPVEIEIGHGKGSFLVEASGLLPHTNFLGLEWSNKAHLFAAERIAKRNFGNVRFLRGDAQEIFATRIPKGSVRAIHIYFPDPYWKRRHLKRRLVTPEFALSIANALTPGGRVLTKSDVPERFAVLTETIAECAEFRPIAWDDAAVGYPPVVSNFERKAHLAGRPVECAAFERR